MGPKRCIITNWEPYFFVHFQITLVSQRHSSMLVNKNCAFYDNELSIGPCMCYIQEDASVMCTVTGLPFDQMEPSRSMQDRSGNPVRILKSEWDFPDFWIESGNKQANFWLSFTRDFYEWVNDRLMANNYKQYFASSKVSFGLLLQTYFKSSRSV